MMSRLDRFRRLIPTLFLLFAVGGALLMVTPRQAGADPNAFPATGQTTCWDTSGNVISCTGTGQDGDLQKGAPLSYTDNADGTITDNNTGLVWEKLSLDGSVHDVGNTYSWDGAFVVHVATLNSTSFAGHTDWRVPNVKELQSIVNFENILPAVSSAFNNNCVANCTVLTCSCTANNFYWSSTTAVGSVTNAFIQSFVDGTAGFSSKSFAAFPVRGVRGGAEGPPLLPDGAPCTRNAQCSSGKCRGGKNKKCQGD